MDLPQVLFLAFGLAALPADDKKLHFGAGAITSYVADQAGLSPLQSCMATFAIGLGKEIYDARGSGNVEVHDALATTLGCGITFRW